MKFYRKTDRLSTVILNFLKSLNFCINIKKMYNYNNGRFSSVISPLITTFVGPVRKIP